MNIQILLAIFLSIILFGLYLVIDLKQDTNHSKIILFCRHGAKSPTIYPPNQKIWNQYDYEGLTKKGFKQMMELGKHYQERSIFGDGVGKCNYEIMQIQSSTKQRSILSTIAFVIGLCPDNYQYILQRLFKEYYSQYSLNMEEFHRILASNFSDPFAYNFSIFMNPHDVLFQGNSRQVCPIIKLIKNWMQSQNEFIKKQEEFRIRPEYEEVVHQMQKYEQTQNYTNKYGQNSPTIGQMKNFYGSFMCCQFEGLEQPKLTTKAQQFLSEVFTYHQYTVLNSQQIQHKIALSEIAKWIIRELYSNILLNVFSGHDLNLIAIFSILIDEQIYPPFAANLELQIKGDQVDFYFLGKLLETKLCSSKINCSRQDVVTYLKPYVIEDISSFCKLP